MNKSEIPLSDQEVKFNNQRRQESWRAADASCRLLTSEQTADDRIAVLATGQLNGEMLRLVLQTNNSPQKNKPTQ